MTERRMHHNRSGFYADCGSPLSLVPSTNDWSKVTCQSCRKSGLRQLRELLKAKREWEVSR